MLSSYQPILFSASCILHWIDKRDKMRLNTKMKTGKEEYLLKYLFKSASSPSSLSP